MSKNEKVCCKCPFTTASCPVLEISMDSSTPFTWHVTDAVALSWRRFSVAKSRCVGTHQTYTWARAHCYSTDPEIHSSSVTTLSWWESGESGVYLGNAMQKKKADGFLPGDKLSFQLTFWYGFGIWKETWDHREIHTDTRSSMNIFKERLVPVKILPTVQYVSSIRQCKDRSDKNYKKA